MLVSINTRAIRGSSSLNHLIPWNVSDVHGENHPNYPLPCLVTVSGISDFQGSQLCFRDPDLGDVPSNNRGLVKKTLPSGKLT